MDTASEVEELDIDVAPAPYTASRGAAKLQVFIARYRLVLNLGKPKILMSMTLNVKGFFICDKNNLIVNSYNPYDGPNDNPELELPLTAGEYIYVYGDMDDDGFYEGKSGV